MISSSRQLKDKVRNISDGNSNKASTLIRNFMMERFLERVSISSYRDNFILKGERLGVDEDPDVESIINYMFDITRTVAEKMFAYGAALGEN